MPKANPAKIKSALKKNFLPALALILVAIFVLLEIIFYVPVTQPDAPKNYVAFDGMRIYVDLALTPSEQIKGLGGKESLAPGNGMLFVFDKPKEQCFWMKDMKFAIDIVWINAYGKVAKIDQAVSPETYPTSFCSEKPVKYVLEIPANTSSAYKIIVDAQLRKNF